MVIAKKKLMENKWNNFLIFRKKLYKTKKNKFIHVCQIHSARVKIMNLSFGILHNQSINCSFAYSMKEFQLIDYIKLEFPKVASIDEENL